ncbi:Methionine ABC transporter ATP-binding protein [Fulvivirga imtechensis AK7]|uniref:Methionine ABC transporter ATP-binding protein n=1 Tax=Fulvivirga imtechensis AK7 TaxID=1237149 RepID=L8JW90_9BACT|nr:ATP-binding cassette domain-containing protein [Fulvivirga imtechensis]ELR73291.1 Methionine ABC transporter ATP-binding protein [Fulvivirga imtechensis AK7]
MKEEEIVIDIQELKKSFGDNEVLKGMNLQLHRKENLVILGKSGTGKSVLIKCIVKLIEPDEGRLRVLDQEVKDLEADEELNKLRRRVGFLFQGGALYDSMSVRENLRFPLERLSDKPSRDEMEDRVYEALRSVGLEKAIDKMPAELSGGMKKRIALARTLILKPAIVLYDEPTTGLDPATSKEISQLILEMQQEYDISSIIITHDMACARITSNKMKVIRNGVFKYKGTYDELREKNDPWLRDFFE